MSATLSDVVAEGERLVGLAASADTTLALLGGVAVRVHAPETPPALARDYMDLDFAVPKVGASAAGQLLSGAGYQPAVSFNALNGGERLLFHDLTRDRQVDVFVGSFRMCHEIPWTDRLLPGQATVPLAELLLTKLQIVELNEKDVRDAILLLHGHAIADHDDDVINAVRTAQLCANDWGLWRTITANLARVGELLDDYQLPDAERRRVGDRLAELLTRIDQEPKSRGWRLRARIGERKRWYELPEEVNQ